MKNFILILSATFAIFLAFTSCKSKQQVLTIPHSISTADATTIASLRLPSDNYDILNTVTETASVSCKYDGSKITITSNDGEFRYEFQQNQDGNWNLKSFAGVASFGYLSSDYNNPQNVMPDAEIFARRVAIAKVIAAVSDFGADGIIEPIVVTQASQEDRNTVVYSAKVSAKIIKLRSK